jgi:Ca2+-binding RTX toxin-like protein
MFNKQSVFVAAVSISAVLLGVSAASAESQKCYTLASLQGNYAIVGNYGANVAIALGIRSYDGNGNLTGTFLVNGPDLVAGQSIPRGDLNAVRAVDRFCPSANADVVAHGASRSTRARR